MRSGLRIDARAPALLSIRVTDIGAHLSKLCIYNGAPVSFYSEAQHAVLVAAELARTEGALGALYGLLHNAHLTVRSANDAERQNVMRSVFEAIDLDWPIPSSTLRALLHVNAQVVLAEIRQLMTGWENVADTMQREGIIPLRQVIRPLPWDRAMDTFINAARGYAVAANLRPMPALEGIL